jgi:hypothetical protein
MMLLTQKSQTTFLHFMLTIENEMLETSYCCELFFIFNVRVNPDGTLSIHYPTGKIVIPNDNFWY